jgi:uncharacterized membrane protein
MQPMERTIPQPHSRLDAIARWGLRHWLPLICAGVALYGGLAVLAPVLTAGGYTRLGEALFLLYTPFCHQRPERSYFVLGHQVAICHRELAMYSFVLLGALVYAPLRRRLRPLGGVGTLLLLLPMLLDGGTHALDDLLGLGARGGGDDVGTLNWWLRMLTALLFAVAVVWGIFPRLERDLRPVRTEG